jgi:hypothetical protein
MARGPRVPGSGPGDPAAPGSTKRGGRVRRPAFSRACAQICLIDVTAAEEHTLPGWPWVTLQMAAVR